MPSLPHWADEEDDPLHRPLLGPSPAQMWRRGDTLIEWGMPWLYPKGHASVERALIEIPALDTAEAAQAVYGAFPRRVHLLSST